MEAPERVPRGVAKLVESFLNCKPLLSRVVGRIVRPSEIEDIVQETFVLSYAAARHQDIANPRAFMLRTARNIALDHIGSAGRRLNCSLEELGDEAFMSQVSTIEAEVQSDERFLAFCRAVSELPVHCRRVFILKKVYGLSQKEIASCLGLSPRTVEKHVARGMFMTARYMQAKGLAHGTLDGSLCDRDEVERR
jgi:RNA polymerase sigma-70 factor (ECF subfamily)